MRKRFLSKGQGRAGGRQGDQIGRILAYWAIIFFGKFFEYDRMGLNFLGYFFPAVKITFKI
jgi:hypothetical protein